MSGPVFVRHCRFCRAENPTGAPECWLCEAPDWDAPAPKPPAPLRPDPFAFPPAPERLSALPDVAGVTGLLVLPVVVVVTGVALSNPAAAVLVALGWGLLLAFLIYRRADPSWTDSVRAALALFLAAVATALLAVISFVIAVFLVCARGLAG